MTAVITGATRGIGRACAKMFFDAGYHVIGVYRSSEDIADAMSAEGYEMYRCDVSDSESVADMCSVIHTADVLVNCA
ncbi:MAG: SDR family NAD(P)-dependent oxidoreductase, partial [Oscillospiraceae bacterium]|nr:SDR family NAD(P)-dependent oxidoreductase [Oscillospiraceae bacterium]